jgi:hypothetical protein
MPPDVANSRKHWAVRHKDSKAFAADCDALQAGGILPPPPARPWPKATIASWMTLFNPMDADNSVSRHKALIDWLVTRGYLLDDRRKCLTWVAMPNQRISRKNEPEIEIVLTRAD